MVSAILMDVLSCYVLCCILLCSKGCVLLSFLISQLQKSEKYQPACKNYMACTEYFTQTIDHMAFAVCATFSSATTTSEPCTSSSSTRAAGTSAPGTSVFTSNTDIDVHMFPSQFNVLILFFTVHGS